MKVIIKKPGEEAKLARVANNLKRLQTLVGGHIEVVRIGSAAALIVNEEGKLLTLPFNFRIPYDTIVGTAIVVGIAGDEFTDCPISLEQFNAMLEEWSR